MDLNRELLQQLLKENDALKKEAASMKQFVKKFAEETVAIVNETRKQVALNTQAITDARTQLTDLQRKKGRVKSGR